MSNVGAPLCATTLFKYTPVLLCDRRGSTDHLGNDGEQPAEAVGKGRPNVVCALNAEERENGRISVAL